MAHYPPEWTMREARALYFEENGFGADGGYHKKWDWFSIGPLRLPIPNPPARQRALAFHDMHHVLTGYHTDWQGEFEIAAWEVAAGCGRLWFAWLLNLGGFFLAFVLIPRRAWRAFLRGRQSRGLYETDVDSILDRRVGDVRESTRVDVEPGPATLADRLAFAGWYLVSAVWAAVQLGVVLGVPFALAWWVFR